MIVADDGVARWYSGCERKGERASRFAETGTLQRRASAGTWEWVPPGRARGTHFVSLRLRCAPLRATPRRLSFPRDPIPSEGPRPESRGRNNRFFLILSGKLSLSLTVQLRNTPTLTLPRPRHKPAGSSTGGGNDGRPDFIFPPAEGERILFSHSV